MQKLILASTSPRRIELLEALQVHFITCAPKVKEIELHDMPPHTLTLKNAQIKANFCSSQHPHSYVLAADTTVWFNNKNYFKPQNLQEATEFLLDFSNNTQQVFTATALINPSVNFIDLHVEESTVTFKPLTPEIIANYFQFVSPLDKAGAYGIQEHSDLIIRNYTGSLNNIIGLPTEYLIPKLKALNLL